MFRGSLREKAMKLTPVDRRDYVALAVTTVSTLAFVALLVYFGVIVYDVWNLRAARLPVLCTLGMVGRMLITAFREPPRQSIWGTTRRLQSRSRIVRGLR